MKLRVLGLRFLFVLTLFLGLILWEISTGFAQSSGFFNQVVESAKAEMEKEGGKIFLATEWTKREGMPVLKAFQKDFPFVKHVDFDRVRQVDQMQRILLEVQQGRTPPYNIMHVSSESWPDYEKAGLFVKPPFDYKKLAKSIPADWGQIDDRAFDPKGMFVATTGLARGNAWNPAMVPGGKEPTTWDACLDPMWKGKILYDPRPKLTGLWWDPKTKESHISWLKGIMKNGAVLNRGQTENVQKVITGEFPIVCGVNFHSAFRLIDKGAPLKFTFPETFPMDMGTQIHIVKWSNIPATTQLFVVWVATKAQPLVSETGYRGLPWHPGSKKYEPAKGKYIALCDAECIRNEEPYIKLHGDILNLPGIR